MKYELIRHTASKSEIELLKTIVQQGVDAANKTKEMPDDIRRTIHSLNEHLKTAQRLSFTYIVSYT